MSLRAMPVIWLTIVDARDGCCSDAISNTLSASTEISAPNVSIGTCARNGIS